MLKSSSKLAPVVTKKRSGQSLKPNNKHNIYKFQFVLLHLKNVQFCFMCWFLFLLSSQLAPSPVWGMAVWLQSVVILSRQDTECYKEEEWIPLALLLWYGVWVMSVIKDFSFSNQVFRMHPLCINRCIVDDLFHHHH